MMTENELRQKVVTIAENWLGCRESNGTHKPIVDLYNTLSPLPMGYKMTYTDPWCAAFVSAVGIKAGLTDIMPCECGTGRLIELYRKIGRWVENDAHEPQAGDLILYNWSDDGKGDNMTGSSHVGIVVEVKGGNIKVIEGNISNAVGYRNIAVNGRYIRGFCCPDYASKAKPVAATATENGKRYKTIDDVPDSLKAETQELIAAGALKGKGGNAGLDVTEDMLRCMIISKRYAETLAKQ